MCAVLKWQMFISHNDFKKNISYFVFIFYKHINQFMGIKLSLGFDLKR